MSNIRISNGSPNPERMEARQAEDPKRSACRRNLFGWVDHEELKKDFEKHQKDMEEEWKKTWNFDFKNHRPLEGRYKWKTVDPDDLPEFYSRSFKRSCTSGSSESLDVNGNCAVILPGSQGISEGARLVDQKTKESESQTDLIDQCTGQRKRSATDDSSPQNKRANTTEATTSGDSSDSSVEQTPKKNGPRGHQT